MAKPPPLPGHRPATPANSSAVAENHVDRSIRLGQGGDAEAALRWCAAGVRKAPDEPVALFLTSWWLNELGRPEAAGIIGRVAAERSIDAGNLPLAIASCALLRRAEQDYAAELESVVTAFNRTSTRLLEKNVSPPRLGPLSEASEPLADSLSGEGLLSEAMDIVEQARAALQADHSDRQDAPRVPSQNLFSSFGAEALRALAESFDVRLVCKGDRLIAQGEDGDAAFVVARGELEVVRSGTEGQPPVRLARLGGGALIGEMALLSRSPRAASVVVLRPAVVLETYKEDLDAVAARQPEVGQELAAQFRRRMVENLVRTSTMLKAVEPRERSRLVDSFVTRTYAAGERLITEGKPTDGLHLIASGSVLVEHEENGERLHLARVGVGEVVGEVALVLRRPSNADVVAEHATVTLHLPAERFQAVIKEHPALLGQLYQLAVDRDQETSSIVAQEATEADDFVLL